MIRIFVTGETSTNCSSNLASILLQTAEIVLENPFNTKEMRVKALLDQRSQRSYLSQRIKSILDLAPISKENISISTFGNPNSKQSTLENVCFNLKNESEQTFPIELGWVLNGPVTSFEVSTNLTSESEYSHILFLNTDQSVRIENINFNVVSGI